MTRVVSDQRRKFESDESFLNLSRPCEVRYTGLPMGNDDERRSRFQQDCRDGRIEIACIPSGFNLELYIPPSNSQQTTPHAPNQQETSELSRDYIEAGADRLKVHICSHFILNGVCVRWRGYIDSQTLRGQGCIELDEARAQLEDQRLRQELRTLEERIPFFRNLQIPNLPTVAAANATSMQEDVINHQSNRAMSMQTQSAPVPRVRTSSSSSNSANGT